MIRNHAKSHEGNPNYQVNFGCDDKRLPNIMSLDSELNMNLGVWLKSNFEAALFASEVSTDCVLRIRKENGMSYYQWILREKEEFSN